MKNYIDGFVFPISRTHLDEYKCVALSVAEIWKEHGALAYFEYLADDMKLEGTQSFTGLISTSEDETVIFGWVVFESRESRDHIHQLVADDLRMKQLVEPLIDPNKIIFDAKRMVYGGFQSFIP